MGARALLRLRRDLEDGFLRRLRAGAPGGDDVGTALGELLVEDLDAPGVSHHLKDDGERWQLREYLVHRSLYHLKEADPHAWVIPRLHGPGQGVVVAVEFDEFGGGHADRMHSRLFADLMAEAGLDAGYRYYLEVARPSRSRPST